jgi:hypothetical protein
LTFKKPAKNEVFCIVLFEGTFTSFFKDKKSQRSHKTVEIKVFSYYFCLMIEISGSGSIPLTNGSGSGSLRPKSTDPDPEHCIKPNQDGLTKAYPMIPFAG